MEGLDFLKDSVLGGLRDLGETIGGFFDGLADKISGFFEWLLDGIAELLLSLLEGIGELLKFLFVPSDNFASDLKDKIYEKFPFVEHVSSVVQAFLDIGDGAVEPDFSFTWYGTTVEIVSFDLVEDFIPVVHTIIIAVCWATFFIRLYKSVPRLIGGMR